MAKWTPQDDQPALTLAAIRWYALSIEKLAIDLYTTDAEKYPDVKRHLGHCFRELGRMRKHLFQEFEKERQKGADLEMATAAQYTQPEPQKMMLQEDGRCGPGYVYCYGVCLPDCDDLEAY